MESGTPAKRALQRSCARCKRRKIRCDGSIPHCSSCVGNEDECVYPTEVRRRGPGKNKQRVESLEQRLVEMESRLRQLGPVADQDDDPSSNAAAGEQTPDDQQLARIMFSQSFWSMITDRIQRFDVVKKSPGSLRFGTPSAIVPEELERFLARSFTRDICREIPFLQVDKFIERLNKPGSLGHTDNNWWTLLNATIAITSNMKIDNDSTEQLLPIPWAFYKNAYSRYSRLLAGQCDEWTVQASLAMAFFLHGSADMRTTATLLSAATRQLQVQDLQGEGETFHASDLTVDDSRSRVFWAAFILDSDQSLNTGLSPSLPEGEFQMGIPLPTMYTGDETTYQRVFKARAELALIQGRIREQLYGPRSLAKTTTDMLFRIRQLQRSLSEWTSQVPSDVWPKNETTQGSLDLPHAMVRLAYYNCMSIVNWYGVTQLRQLGTTVAAMAERVRASARATIELVQRLHDLSLVDLWRVLRYQVAAAITLLVCILQDATHSEVAQDLAALENLVAYVAQLVEREHCDLREVLIGCRQMYNLAMTAVQDQFPGRETEASTLAESIDHPMRVAQRWMGNLQTTKNEAAQTLATLLGFPPNSSGGYGPLTPLSMRPETYEPETNSSS